MPELRVTERFRAPLARVFDAASDHERLLSFGPTHTKLVRDGDGARNGRGAVREVTTGGLVRFVEEITVWDAPRSYEYLVTESTLPVRHHGGRLEFSESDGITTVDWSTRFDIPVPILGRLLTPVVKRAFRKAFRDALARVKTRVES